MKGITVPLEATFEVMRELTDDGQVELAFDGPKQVFDWYSLVLTQPGPVWGPGLVESWGRVRLGLGVGLGELGGIPDLGSRDHPPDSPTWGSWGLGPGSGEQDGAGAEVR